MNGNQPVGTPDPNDPLANPVPAQRIPDPTPEDFLNWVHERFGQYIQEQPPARVPPPKMTGGQVWDLQHATGPLQQLMTERLLMKDPAYRDYMTKQAAYEEHQKQLGQIAPMLGAGVRGQYGLEAAGVRGQTARDVTGMRDEAALQRQGWVKVQDINGEWTWIRNPNVPTGAATPQTSGQPPINMASPNPTPEPSMKVRPGTPSNVSSAPGQSLNVLRSGVKGPLKAPLKPQQYQLHDTPRGPMYFDPTRPDLPGVPAKYPSGEDVGPRPNLQASQAMTSLKDLKQTYSDLKELYRAGHGYILNPNTHKIERTTGQPSDVLVHGAGGSGVLVHPSAQTRTEQILSGWATRPSLTRGAFSGLMPAAATHEELRAKTIPQLLRPISGQSRAMASLMEQFQHFLPDWTTAPEAAEPAFANADALIERAERDLNTAFPQSGGGPNPQPTGRKTPQQIWDEINAGR